MDTVFDTPTLVNAYSALLRQARPLGLKGRPYVPLMAGRASCGRMEYSTQPARESFAGRRDDTRYRHDIAPDEKHRR